MSVTMFIRHRVADFDTWHRVYREVAPMQRAGGVVSEAVYQTASDPNDVTVTHDFADEAAARAFSGSQDLKAAMERAGVVEQPTIWITRTA
jgi:quinol monooxygenase YgiN